MIIQYGSGVGAATEQVNGVVCKTIEAGGGTLAALQFIKRNENISIIFVPTMHINCWTNSKKV